MPNLRMIRRQITAVQSIQQVTRAMRMIAASRLRRAQDALECARPYAVRLNELMEHMAARIDQEAEPFFEQRERKRVTIILVAGDRGLCRGFNANVQRLAIQRQKELEEQGIDTEFIAVGKKPVDFLRRRRIETLDEFPGIFQHLHFSDAAAISDLARNRFSSGETDEVEIIFNEFKTVLKQELRVLQYLPLKPVKPEEDSLTKYIYEPDKQEIWRELLDKFLNFEIWRILLESDSSEQAARMTAMEEATNNAEDVIKNLISVRNKVRQTGITTELSEIVGSAEALRV